MREILFRGQTRRRGEQVNMAGDKLPERWVYGGVLQGTGDYSIIYGGKNLGDIEKHTVYTDTIGQYTGLTDKNGVKIFEGDIVSYNGKNEVVYFDTSVRIPCFTTGIGSGSSTALHPYKLSARHKVIGNIHDNPEFIGGGKDDA